MSGSRDWCIDSVADVVVNVVVVTFVKGVRVGTQGRMSFARAKGVTNRILVDGIGPLRRSIPALGRLSDRRGGVALISVAISVMTVTATITSATSSTSFSAIISVATASAVTVWFISARNFKFRLVVRNQMRFQGGVVDGLIGNS